MSQSRFKHCLIYLETVPSTFRGTMYTNRLLIVWWVWFYIVWISYIFVFMIPLFWWYQCIVIWCRFMEWLWNCLMVGPTGCPVSHRVVPVNERNLYLFLNAQFLDTYNIFSSYKLLCYFCILTLLPYEHCIFF